MTRDTRCTVTLLVSLVVLVSGTAPAAAQSPDTAVAADTFDLPDIVVTATRVPLPRGALPTPVTVWTGEELRELGIRTVSEALRRVPSAALAQAGAPGAQTSLFLRGGESDYVKVLVDGVPVNDPGGAFDFADLSTDQVERVEVVRGPTSVLYGSDAMVGVVQVFTRRGAGPPSVSAQVLAGRGQERAGTDAGAQPPGAYGAVDAEATVTGAAGALAYTVGGGRSWSQGSYPFNSQRGFSTGTVRLAWAPVGGPEVEASTRLTDSRSHFPTDGAGALVDRNAVLDRRQWTTSMAVGFQLHDRVGGRLRGGLMTRDQRTVDEQDGPADTLGTYASVLGWGVTRRTLEARVDAELPGSVVSAGVAWEDAQATTSYESESSFGPFAAEAPYRRSTRGVYVQVLTEPVYRLHLTLGGRLDDSETYGTFRTYRVGAAMELVGGTRLRAALGRGFREPAFDQVFGSGFGDLGNTVLEPEESRSWEAGIEQELGPATLVATWFDQRFYNLIQFTFSPPTAGGPNYFNVGAASARGLELEARGSIRRLDVTASYSYLETEVLDPGLATDAGFVMGEVLLRRPGRSGTLAGRYAVGQGSVSLTLNAMGKRKDLDFGAGFPAPRITLPAYATVDLAAEHPIPVSGAATTVLVRIVNMMDARYETVAGFPGLGRLVRIGARVRLR